MRSGWLPVAAVIFIIVTFQANVNGAEDLYLEGEDEASNEFLEVNDNDNSFVSRVKRDFFNLFDLMGSSTTTEAPVESTDDPYEDTGDKDDEDTESTFGSGSPPERGRDEEKRIEKTLRVSFVVYEPYQDKYFDRDSYQFKNLSRSLADAVNLLYVHLPGRQRASLVRIESRISDEFSCKVTLDIITNGYDDTDVITKILKDHISHNRHLGTFTVSDNDFNAVVINPDAAIDSSIRDACGPFESRCDNGQCVGKLARCNDQIDCKDGSDELNCSKPLQSTCSNDQLSCDNGQCVPGDSLCNGLRDCSDGSDELNCVTESQHQEQETYDEREEISTTESFYFTSTESPRGDEVLDCETFNCPNSDVNLCDYKRCDGTPDCPDGSDELSCTSETVCPDGYLRCDETRCYLKAERCNGVIDCNDSTDEADCGDSNKQCGADDFHCSSGRCIDFFRKCDQVKDCEDGDDERDCDCGPEEFSCVSDGACIEARKRCDRQQHCSDNSDEIDCPDSRTCGSTKWQCDNGNCIDRIKRCDGRVDCPADRSDERECLARTTFRCATGKVIPYDMRCNLHYDCPLGDYSDEKNCPCRDGDFKCDNGNCIPVSKHCDRTRDCQDGSDERNCNNDTICMASEYKCSNGECVNADLHCDGTKDCIDASDEIDCPCETDQFRCRHGTCINVVHRCNSIYDCQDGEDEINCVPTQICAADTFECSDGNCLPLYKKCNDVSDCPEGEDELNCVLECKPDFQITCRSGDCVDIFHRCDGNNDCPDGDDEFDCDKVPDCDYECDGKCLHSDQICDGVPDCSDDSDEENCKYCNGIEDHQCNSGECISIRQRCNSIKDCSDGSDENQCNEIIVGRKENCTSDQFECRNGICIDINFVCDGHPDCLDNSDEESCGCSEGQYQCNDGHCIDQISYCDGLADCRDSSDEWNCLPDLPSTPTYERTTHFDSHTETVYRPREPEFRPTSPPDFRPQYPSTPGYTNNDGCDLYEWRCENGPCIHESLRCNGRIDCRDSSDELDCPATNNGCNLYEWRCENGPCIHKSLRCNGRIDCRDSSDELDCLPNSPTELNLKIHPDAQTMRSVYKTGGDIVFSCRDEGPIRARVRWMREDGRPLKVGSTDIKGRLEMFNVTPQDSGVYICHAPEYAGMPGSEIRAHLTVDYPVITNSRPSSTCKPNEATCANSECIPKSAVCNGKRDCSDGSDEDSCNVNGSCEPNEFQCANRRCILKTWLCDLENDCIDNSDEVNCGTPSPGESCRPVEFKCKNDQCIPKSFHCDGTSDCLDGSDEHGCVAVYVTKPPTPSTVVIQPYETLSLECEAVGVPVPLISWRLNWGHVPNKCRSTSENGTGILICPNMQQTDCGAYSCEAMNNKGTSFAEPDAIVRVGDCDVNGQVCPSGYFNREARTQSDCIGCFCFGVTHTCSSADLFTFTIPTALGEGGTRLLGVQEKFNGDIDVDSQTITDDYYYQPLFNGATVTKLDTYTSSPSHPYISLPETYNGNQLKSYGGQIKYQLHPHVYRRTFGTDSALPDIIIKGQFGTLVHQENRDRNQQRQIWMKTQITPLYWQKVTPNGLVQATREDIMMVLDNIQHILLKASLNGAGVNITEFSMQSAQSANNGEGATSLVEECSCPPGYTGLSCEKCSVGYVRKNSGAWLGSCVPEQPKCPPLHFGDPNSGYACRPCPCPLTNRGNQFASGCDIGPAGRVICQCQPGYDGDNCDRCAEGYTGNPNIPGDRCVPEQFSNCNSIGTLSERYPNQCECKDNVQGVYCDQCKEGSFFLSDDFRHGCAQCFCSGVSSECTSSNLRRKTSTVHFNVPDIVNQVRVYNSSGSERTGFRQYNAPIETNLTPNLYNGLMSFPISRRSHNTIYYWSLPPQFSGDKVTSYGGYLRYVLRNIPTRSGALNTAPDIQLISDNHLTFNYIGKLEPSEDGSLNVSVQFLEKFWQRHDGKEVQREQLLLALADVKVILIKAIYSSSSQIASIESASIETAENGGYGSPALHVEQCQCDVGYLGTSCEDCAPGYTRTDIGLYLKTCGPCDCNGHSSNCNPESGVCYECDDNTEGDKCERCKPGYDRDVYNRCVSSSPPDENVDCNCDPRGEARPCIDRYCECKRNVYGEKCDRCRPGTFGLSGENRDGCIACYCSGITSDCYEANGYSVIPIPASIFGSNYGGYIIQNLNADSVINDNFVPATNESELMYIFDNPPQETLYWSLPEFHGNRLLSYGGKLSLKQRFESTNVYSVSNPGNDVVLVGSSSMIYWINPRRIRPGEEVSNEVTLTEYGWHHFDGSDVTRDEFMDVLRDLRRVLVKATLTDDVVSTAIADVYLETASDTYNSGVQARGIEICKCPAGYTGTSCETCSKNYYKDTTGACKPCNCNGNTCQLGPYDEVICNCEPPLTGKDCSTIGTDSFTTTTPRQPPLESTVQVRITSPTIRIQEVGSTVNFTCQARSRAYQGPVAVKWSKSEGYLPSPRSYTNDKGLLLIRNVQISDSGIYLCQATDGVSTAEAQVTLKVPGNPMTAPEVSIRTPKVYYREGERVEMECFTSGNPTPVTSWKRNDNRALPMTSEVQGPRFIIHSAREEDSGNYSCTATNNVDSRSDTIRIFITPRLTTRDRLTISPESPTVSEGYGVRITCTGTPGIPIDSITWSRQDGSQLPSNVRSRNGVLYIEIAVIENEGVYVCQSNSPDVQAASVFITVTNRDQPEPGDEPTVSILNATHRIHSGDTHIIECIPHGYPLPLIRWKKFNNEMGQSTSQRGNSLVFANAQESDAGYYVCEGVIDSVPVHNMYVAVDVEKREPPRVQIMETGERTVYVYTQYELHCRVEGTPEPTVSWSRPDGRDLSPFTHILPNNILKFDNVTVNDDGEYACTGSNAVGDTTATSIIRVISQPSILIAPSDNIGAIRGDSVKVDCRASGIPLPEVRITKDGDNRVLASSTTGVATLYISSVTESDSGVYTCTATSPVGVRDSQFYVDVKRGDGGDGDDIEGSGEGDFDPSRPERFQVYVIYGKDSRISCNDTNYPYSVVWSRTDGRRLQANAEQINNELIIHEASYNDDGEYECTLISPYDNQPRATRYTLVKVMRPPTITLSPATQTVQPGQSPTVECIVDGDDIRNINWTPVAKNYSNRVQTHDAVLIFRQIEIEDAGFYVCAASNLVANASATAEVIVSAPSDLHPTVSHDNVQHARIGSSVHLSCNVTLRNFKMTWTKNGRELPKSVHINADGSLFIGRVQRNDSGQYICNIKDPAGRTTNNYIDLHIDGSRDVSSLVKIEQLRRRYKVGEDVRVLCRSSSRDTQITWERVGTNQYVAARTFADGSMLNVPNVKEADNGTYRCIGRDNYGRTSYDEFSLDVEPAKEEETPYPVSDQVYSAPLSTDVIMPCNYDLEEPVSIEWSRDIVPISSRTRSNEKNLRLYQVSEHDAGTYRCRVSNSRLSVDVRATLRVTGIVPMFDGTSYIGLPTLPDAFNQFNIYVSFRPAHNNGIILFNSENNSRDGDYLALVLQNGVPVLLIKLERYTKTITLPGDRPLQLNTWHTINLKRNNVRVSMEIDNSYTASTDALDKWLPLDLKENLYVGGVPDNVYNTIPMELSGLEGFVGCISSLILGREEKNLMTESIDQYNIKTCDTCTPNHCLNNGICQEARNERGFSCFCPDGFAGLDCSRTGEACRPGICGPGKCIDITDGFKCVCPVTFSGRRCEVPQSIEYPAFTGSSYLAIDTPKTSKVFRMSMKLKANTLADGVIMYCASSSRGQDGFTSLALHDSNLEFKFDLGDGNGPVVLRSSKPLITNDWIDVYLTRLTGSVSMKINKTDVVEGKVISKKRDLVFGTPLFIGGYDDTVTLNKEVGVTGGFNGCVKDVTLSNMKIDIINSSIHSVNVQECNRHERGDVPEDEIECSRCQNGASCRPGENTCDCPIGYTGLYCERREDRRPFARSTRPPAPTDPCAQSPCRNGGTCRQSSTSQFGYTCDCLMGFAGTFCHMPLQLGTSVAFKGNGYLELPGDLLTYERLNQRPAIIALAIYTSNDGVLIYQKEALSGAGVGDYVLLHIVDGFMVLEWDLGSGRTSITIRDVHISDGHRHQIIAKIQDNQMASLSVDGITKEESASGFGNVMNADSNIYLGGMPEYLNYLDLPGFTGCIEQVEFTNSDRGVNLGSTAVTGRNPQLCHDRYRA